MIWILGMLAAGVWTTLTGPAFDDWRAGRRTRREFPTAKVVFLLPSVCDPR